MSLDGLVIGVGTFLIIGLLHPVVIKTEYYSGVKFWYIFLAAGFFFVVLSVFTAGIVSALSAVLGVSLLWSIQELLEQRERVKKGWFPKNPNRK